MILSLEKYEIREKPFKHIVYRDTIKADQKEVTLEALNQIEKQKCLLVENENFSKIELKKSSGICGKLMESMSSKELASLCSNLFSIPNIEPDPQFDGGGLTYTEVGKYLRYHYDFPYSNTAKKYRVINALLYLSDPNIKGGDLHLLDPESGTVESCIEPKFGTLAIFATSNKTPHGVSKIYSHPRIAINSYFYANQPLDERTEPSKTIWLNNMKTVKR